MRMDRMTLVLLGMALAASGQNAEPAAANVETHGTAPLEVRTTFHVRYVSGNNVYVDGGRSANLAEGMHLVLQGEPAKQSKPAAAAPTNSNESSDNAAAQEPVELPTIAELKVVAVAETSAVCEIVSSRRPVAAGDTVTLPQDEVERLVEKRTLGGTRNYLAVVSFTEGDPMDEDVRDAVPRPPLPEVNRAQGRIGFNFSTTQGGGATSVTAGLVLRADITRISGSYWNLNGFWRGNLTSRNSIGQPTLQDLINRTYQLSLSYQNPNSRWVAAVGRLYLPWAVSLDTLDGGYFGRRLSQTTTAGIFAGSTPNPTSWSYDPNRRIAGTFVNFTGGSYDDLRYSSTFGGGVSMLKWQVDRPFVFTENTIDYRRVLSLYEAMQIDRPTVGPGVMSVGLGIKSSFITLRVQPNSRLSFDFNHNYFRDIPTYNPQLLGTGLLDKYLFQGFSGGVRAEVPAHIALYATVGRSNVSGDPSASWSTLFGITFNRLSKTGLRFDARYSKFNSPFAQGDYRTFSLSRSFRDAAHIEVQAGMQKYTSQWSRDTGSRFVNAFGEFNVGPRYFFDVGFTLNRGGTQDYNQVYTTFGYRFDNRHRHEVLHADK